MHPVRWSVVLPSFVVPVLVAEQIIRKREFIAKRAVVGRAIVREPHDGRVSVLEVLDSITEPIAFDRSTGCISFGIPPNENVFARMIGQRHIRPVLVRDAEGGRLITDVDHG